MSKLNRILKDRKLDPLPKEESRVEWVSSGIPELDKLISKHNKSDHPGGGFPKNRITEIYGRAGVGKTTIMSHMAPKMGGDILYIDTENAINVDMPDNVTLWREFAMEPIMGVVNDSLEEKLFDVIVIDSVAAMVSIQELSGDEGDANMGAKARLMSQWMRMMTNKLYDSGTAVVFINQQRETMKLFGESLTTPGGKALGYAASLRLELFSNAADRVMRDRKKVGQKVRVKMVKNRFGIDLQEGRFELKFE